MPPDVQEPPSRKARRRGLTSQRLLALAMIFILVSMGALLWHMPSP